jgi:hypothetical protein
MPQSQHDHDYAHASIRLISGTRGGGVPEPPSKIQDSVL